MDGQGQNFSRTARVLYLTGALVCALALPASALGADSFVDKDTGAGSACTQPMPCLTVAAGITAAGANETVHVDDSTTAYTEQVTLGNGKSLLADNFVDGPEGSTIIDGGVGIAISVSASAAGTIQGFNLRGDAAPVDAADDVTITGNTFDDPTESGIDVSIATIGVGPGTVISGNTFSGAPAGVLDNGIAIGGGADPTVLNNNFSGYDFAISPGNDGTDPLIQGNTISGVEGDHPLAAGIFVNDDSEATVIGNTIQMPGAGTRGIYILENTASGMNTGATLRRNKVLGFANGIVAEDTTGAVTLDSDLIANSTMRGLFLRDTFPLVPNEADVTATNVTLASNTVDLDVTDADLTLDSSIVEDAIVDAGAEGTCAISFSRGPVAVPGANGCDNFQTTAVPGFVGGGNFHLALGSAMIDLGNPAAPSVGAVDIDGDPRAIDADGICPLDRVRDIGHDEFLAAEPTGCQPLIPAAVPPASTPPAKKKKCKKKTKKGAAAAKKCKRKKK